jgi:putative endonuclease
MNNRVFGNQGETVAEKYLRRKGYRLVCKNFRTRIGEIDIIVSKGNYLIFCEVKTRKNTNFGMPFEAVDERKQKKIRKVAQLFMQQKSYKKNDVRFDVLSISERNERYEIEHFVGAF